MCPSESRARSQSTQAAPAKVLSFERGGAGAVAVARARWRWRRHCGGGAGADGAACRRLADVGADVVDEDVEVAAERLRRAAHERLAVRGLGAVRHHAAHVVPAGRPLGQARREIVRAARARENACAHALSASAVECQQRQRHGRCGAWGLRRSTAESAGPIRAWRRHSLLAPRLYPRRFPWSPRSPSPVLRPAQSAVPARPVVPRDQLCQPCSRPTSGRCVMSWTEPGPSARALRYSSPPTLGFPYRACLSACLGPGSDQLRNGVSTLMATFQCVH